MRRKAMIKSKIVGTRERETKETSTNEGATAPPESNEERRQRRGDRHDQVEDIGVDEHIVRRRPAPELAEDDGRQQHEVLEQRGQVLTKLSLAEQVGELCP